VGRARLILAGIGLVVLGVVYHERKHPSACPYSARVLLRQPRAGITRERLLEVLAPAPAERVLEVGPGEGYYSFDVAAALVGGRLDVLDVQQEFLEEVMQTAAERGAGNIFATRADARDLPYEDESFDAAFLVTVIGEVPDQDAALQELRRVIKPGGRLVVGETFLGDPHAVTPGRLRERAERAGFSFERRVGNALGYFARFRRP
jgi:ubiquinone/menaquinone biosynthesis C-methylase UbiE